MPYFCSVITKTIATTSSILDKFERIASFTSFHFIRYLDIPVTYLKTHIIDIENVLG